MEIKHIYDLSVEKRTKLQFQCKSDYIRKCILVNTVIREIIREYNKKEEEDWFNSCLDNINQLKLQNDVCTRQLQY
jgi:predicted hydrolase (HD superfamily)